MKNQLPRISRTSLTVGIFLALPLLMVGTWFLGRELFFDHWKKPVAKVSSVQTISKESVDQLNNTLTTNKKDDCEKIENTNLRNVCHDTFTMNEAKQSPLQAQEICNKLRQKFQINACVSGVNMEKALTGTGGIPAASCDTLTDPRWKESCVERKENDALNNAIIHQKLEQGFCNQLTTERIKQDCLSQISP